MIEEYIEKNILRQLFLCGQFYVNKEVNLESSPISCMFAKPLYSMISIT